eukprot:gene47300-6981_t
MGPFPSPARSPRPRTMRAVAFAAAVAGAAADPHATATVRLPYGAVNGNLLAHSREFLGIPFAPTEPWTGMYPGG